MSAWIAVAIIGALVLLLKIHARYIRTKRTLEAERKVREIREKTRERAKELDSSSRDYLISRVRALRAYKNGGSVD